MQLTLQTSEDCKVSLLLPLPIKAKIPYFINNLIVSCLKCNIPDYIIVLSLDIQGGLVSLLMNTKSLDVQAPSNGVMFVCNLYIINPLYMLCHLEII